MAEATQTKMWLTDFPNEIIAYYVSYLDLYSCAMLGLTNKLLAEIISCDKRVKYYRPDNPAKWSINLLNKTWNNLGNGLLLRRVWMKSIQLDSMRKRFHHCNQVFGQYDTWTKLRSGSRRAGVDTLGFAGGLSGGVVVAPMLVESATVATLWGFSITTAGLLFGIPLGAGLAIWTDKKHCEREIQQARFQTIYKQKATTELFNVLEEALLKNPVAKHYFCCLSNRPPAYDRCYEDKYSYVYDIDFLRSQANGAQQVRVFHGPHSSRILNPGEQPPTHGKIATLILSDAQRSFRSIAAQSKPKTKLKQLTLIKSSRQAFALGQVRLVTFKFCFPSPPQSSSPSGNEILSKAWKAVAKSDLLCGNLNVLGFEALQQFAPIKHLFNYKKNYQIDKDLRSQLNKARTGDTVVQFTPMEEIFKQFDLSDET